MVGANWGMVVDEVQRRVSWREEAEERATVGAWEREREWKERRMRARSGGWQRWIRFISRWEALAFPASDDLLGYNVVTHDLSLPTRWLATTLYLLPWLCMRQARVSRELYTLSLSLTHVLPLVTSTYLSMSSRVGGERRKRWRLSRSEPWNTHYISTILAMAAQNRWFYTYIRVCTYVHVHMCTATNKRVRTHM